MDKILIMNNVMNFVIHNFYFIPLRFIPFRGRKMKMLGNKSSCPGLTMLEETLVGEEMDAMNGLKVV